MMKTANLILLIALATTSCSSEAHPVNDASVGGPAASAKLAGLPDRDPALAKKLVGEGALLLDVRTQQEWDKRHLDGANLIPVDDVEARMAEVEKLTGGDKDKPIVVYCGSGNRAGRAKKMLLDAGYTQVTNLGGIDDWPQE